MVNAERLLEILSRCGGVRVGILGDFMLDQYLYGDAERISPEAPVPVLRVVRRESGLGGAGSVAANVAAVGGRVQCVGIVGHDASANQLRRQLTGRGDADIDSPIDATGILTLDTRPTTVKTRLVGLAQHRHRQQIVRVDEEDTSPLGTKVEDVLLNSVRQMVVDCAIICIQDYGKGVVSPRICRETVDMARAAGKRVLIDPMKSQATTHYHGAWICTPNRTETEWIAGVRLSSIAAVREHRKLILSKCGTEHVCVTLDAEGCALIGPGDMFEHVPTQPRDVYDVTGAGDAVLAAMAVSLAAGANLAEAAALANIAGGLEVEKFGCVPITREEMIGEILLQHRADRGKSRTATELRPELSRLQAAGKRVVFTNGCFDILHRGHVEYLQFARQQGDLLVVGLNTDASVRRQNKSAGRPIVPLEDRAAVLAALACVDYVVSFDTDTPLDLITTLLPDVLVKGADWAERGVVGRAEVEARGGKVVLAPMVDGRSTTNIVERIRAAQA